MKRPDGTAAPEERDAGPRDRDVPARNTEEGGAVEPCLSCGVPLSRRLMGCKGGHCPNCGHPYPHGDCSD